MHFRTFFVEELSQSSYLIGCEKAGVCAVVDPERIVEPYLRAAGEKGMKITHVLQTHLHADFVAGHRELAEKAGAKIGMSKKAGAPFDHMPLVDGDRFDFALLGLDYKLHDGFYLQPNVQITNFQAGGVPTEQRFVVTFFGEI